MNSWYSLILGDGVAAYEPTIKIQDAFTAKFMAALGPKDMALFSRYDLHANVATVYFSPAAHIVAELFGATPCEKPSEEDLGLLCGDQRCWEIFFPKRNG